MVSQLVQDFRQVIAGATQAELEKHSGDTITKRNRTSAHAIGIQGMILDAMDDGRLAQVDAHRVLSELQKRLAGMSDDTTKEQQHG